MTIVLLRTTTPQIAGNLSVKMKPTHINPGALGAPEVMKLERGSHFVQRNLISGMGVGGSLTIYHIIRN